MIKGFDYRTGQQIIQSLDDWNEQFQRVIDHGGDDRRIAGDRTAFDKNGRMLFEMHDSEGRQNDLPLR